MKFLCIFFGKILVRMHLNLLVAVKIVFQDLPSLRSQRRLWLLPIPYREIPRNSKPNPNINITNTAVDTGAATAIEPNIMARTPRPIAPHRDLFATNIPLIIFSIPTTIKTMPAMYIIEAIVIPGCTKTNTDNIMARTPRPTSTARNQPGDFDSFTQKS